MIPAVFGRREQRLKRSAPQRPAKNFVASFRLEVVAIVCQKSQEAFFPGVIHFSIRTLVMVLPRLLRLGYTEKLELHYKTIPTLSLLAGLCIHNGHGLGRCYQQHKKYQIFDFTQHLSELYAGRNIYIVLDKPNTNKTELVKNCDCQEKSDPRATHAG